MFVCQKFVCLCLQSKWFIVGLPCRLLLLLFNSTLMGLAPIEAVHPGTDIL